MTDFKPTELAEGKDNAFYSKASKNTGQNNVHTVQQQLGRRAKSNPKFLTNFQSSKLFPIVQ